MLYPIELGVRKGDSTRCLSACDAALRGAWGLPPALSEALSQTSNHCKKNGATQGCEIEGHRRANFFFLLNHLSKRGVYSQNRTRGFPGLPRTLEAAEAASSPERTEALRLLAANLQKAFYRVRARLFQQNPLRIADPRTGRSSRGGRSAPSD
jgi:hypothetical protein